MHKRVRPGLKGIQFHLKVAFDHIFFLKYLANIKDVSANFKTNSK